MKKGANETEKKYKIYSLKRKSVPGHLMLEPRLALTEVRLRRELICTETKGSIPSENDLQLSFQIMKESLRVYLFLQSNNKQKLMLV